MDMLQHRPFMQWLPQLLGMIKHRIDYCAYAHMFKKPTHIWTNLCWLPCGCTGTGRCEGKCGQGKIGSSGKFIHDRAIAQEPHRGPTGVGATKLKNAVPDKRIQEWTEAMVHRRAKHPEQNVIIDLCAGYQSVKTLAMAHVHGFNYIAVDIAGDRN